MPTMFDAAKRESILPVVCAFLFGLRLAFFTGAQDGSRVTGRPNGVDYEHGAEKCHWSSSLSCPARKFLHHFPSATAQPVSCIQQFVSVVKVGENFEKTDYIRRRRRGILEIGPSSAHCAHGSFILNGMVGCHAWLTCDDYNDLSFGPQIGSGAVKQVHLAFWKGYPVAVSTPTTSIDGTVAYPEDFYQGLSNYLLLQRSEQRHRYLVTFVGHCKRADSVRPPFIITEYRRHGNANNLTFALATSISTITRSSTKEILKIRFGLCLDYVAILEWLHGDNSAGGTRVMCDSNSLEKTLEQYLLTDEFRLQLNDLDALPRLDDALVAGQLVCGHRELRGTFVAPEQLWPHVVERRPYDEARMPGYDEKTDIWKVPDVCEHFLMGAADRDVVLYRLFGTHARCKSAAPELRPKASEVRINYRLVWYELFGSDRPE